MTRGKRQWRMILRSFLWVPCAIAVATGGMAPAGEPSPSPAGAVAKGERVGSASTVSVAPACTDGPGGSTLVSHPLTLEEAQAEARRYAPEVAAWLAGSVAARQDLEDARRRFRRDPSVALISKPPRFLQNQSDHLWDISVSLPVGPVSAAEPRRNAAARRATQEALEFSERLATLDEWVARAVADLAHAQRACERARRLAGLAEEMAQRVVARENVAAAALLEADAARYDAWSSQAHLVEARAALEQARLRLARLLGRESPRGLGVDDAFVPPEIPKRPPIGQMVESDRRVRSMRAALDAAREELRLQERLARPAPILGVSYGRGPWGFVGDYLGIPAEGADSRPEVAFTLVVALPLFQRNREARARAKAGVAMAEARLEITRADVRADLEAAWVELEQAAGRLEALREIPETSRRDLERVVELSRAGMLSPEARVHHLRTLEAAAETFEEAVRRWRYARAAWARVAGSPAQSLDNDSGSIYQ